VAVGRLRTGPEADLVSDYLVRLDRIGRQSGLGPTEVVEIGDRKGGGPQAEAALLASAIPGGAIVVALDERGKAVSSPEFARFMQRHVDEGQRDLALVIGGPDGLTREFVASADLSISLGRMVWPHMLVRVMLSEQLYRAASILAGTPYHRA
jgi:23S rRNA (pseudouridine1915-N3)-methyltransferase